MLVEMGAPVSARGVVHRYGGGSHAVLVLDSLDLEVEAGGYVALLGRSGAGKSTLLSLLGGLEAPQSGELTVGGADLRRLRGRRLAAFRRRTVGFVFQHFGLVDVLTAHQNVVIALALARVPRSQRAARASELLDGVGLEHRGNHLPAQLSGGERQRVAIARALANRPRLLLADEPTGNLDEEAAERVLALLEELWRDHGCTLIVVTHNTHVAHRAERRLRLESGRLVEERRPEPHVA